MRAFVIGNGYSLAKTNLELLQNDITFACNRISKIYDTTDWRPTHYVRAEEAGIQSPDTYREDFEIHKDCEIWANPYFFEFIDKKKGHLIRACPHYLDNFDEDTCPTQWHLPHYCSFGSTVNVAIQIAVTLGYGPIYLIGCDLGYKDNEPSHFTDEYEKGLTGLRPARYANMNTFMAHVNAVRSSPVPIFNATIGGELEVYERVDYDGLFEAPTNYCMG